MNDSIIGGRTFASENEARKYASDMSGKEPNTTYWLLAKKSIWFVTYFWKVLGKRQQEGFKIIDEYRNGHSQY